jgi:hypothetical protein
MGLADFMRRYRKVIPSSFDLKQYSAEDKALYAEAILNNPVYRAVVEEIQKDLVNRWRSAPMSDVEGREELFRMNAAIEKIDQSIMSVVSMFKAQGKIAQARENIV